jgi:hypothetical protein
MYIYVYIDKVYVVCRIKARTEVARTFEETSLCVYDIYVYIRTERDRVYVVCRIKARTEVGYMYVCIYACMHVCIYIYICICVDYRQGIRGV